ncbi:MAG: hypothetical protein ACPLKS_04855, partial [Caldisericum exile]|uniref:hypothetical protein n=1 Tax=Caldisericum exile TaxID=693075 RepID=UPI003C776929
MAYIYEVEQLEYKTKELQKKIGRLECGLEESVYYEDFNNAVDEINQRINNKIRILAKENRELKNQIKQLKEQITFLE